MMIRVLVFINLVLVLAIGFYCFFDRPKKQIVYVMNNEVFAGFNGKQLLEDKLNKVRADNKKVLDSLIVMVQRSNKPEVADYYRAKEETFRMNEQSLSEQYTADIWKRINAYLLDFGKEKGYEYILGASGNGTIMYADEGMNVTKDAIEYVNKKYEAED
jgi:outer membrane protein